MENQKPLSAKIGLKRANHVGITVKDLDAAIEFYSAPTGGIITPEDQIGGDRMAKVQGLEKTLIRYATVHLDNINVDLLGYKESHSELFRYRTRLSVHVEENRHLTISAEAASLKSSPE